MDKVIVERAVKALAAIGATRETVPESSPIGAEVRALAPAETETLREGLADCGSPDCDGCYDVGDGKRIHPPKCGTNLVQ
jgi:hypothetical protein